MSVLIRGMAMPKNCEDCPLFESKYHFHGCHAKPESFNDMDMWNFVGDRPSWCPLVPIPPHGDLIDRDAAIRSAFKGEQNIYCWDEIEEAIDSVPAIVESEE